MRKRLAKKILDGTSRLCFKRYRLEEARRRLPTLYVRAWFQLADMPAVMKQFKLVGEAAKHAALSLSKLAAAMAIPDPLPVLPICEQGEQQ